MLDCTSTAVSYFPNTIIPLGSFGYPVLLFWPIDIETTLLEWWYYGPEIGKDAIPEHWQKEQNNLTRSWTKINTIWRLCGSL